MQGRVKSIMKDKGFGFIRSDVDGRDYFFHKSSLKNIDFQDLEEDHEVEFEDCEADKGLRAEDIYV